MQKVEAEQKEIQAILSELNGIAAEEKTFEYLAKDSRELEDEASVLRAQNSTKKQDLEQRLETLGVNTIDPENPSDMAALEEVMLGNNSASERSIPDPPNLEAFADAYTIQQYTQNISHNGTSYRYSYITVTDNKGYSGSPLMHNQSIDIILGNKVGGTVLKDLLAFQASFALSAYLGSIPGGWVADWAIGSVCTILNSLDENSIVTRADNESIYRMSMISVTQMMYIYVYIPSTGNWQLCGTRASDISYARVEYIAANIGGTAYGETKAYGTAYSSTGTLPYNYVHTYLNNGYADIDYIGSFAVNVYGGRSVQFTPGFAPNPGFLL